MTRCGGRIRNKEIFDNKLDSYETKTIFIGRRRLHLRGGGGGDNAQAQLILDVYPSQDSTNHTLWIFSGSSSIASPATLRTSATTHSSADGWQTASDIYNANKPSNQTITLSPLSSSTNRLDIASVNARIPGGGKSNIVFAVTATNTPTITIGTTPVNRTINRMFMNDVTAADNIGIRVSSTFNYGSYSGQASSWVGSGLLEKPIGDFFIKNVGAWATLEPNFARDGVTLRIHSGIIPEPEEYALVFGLFALGFVFFHRRWQRKRRQSATL